jgi:hypothetical protein
MRIDEFKKLLYRDLDAEVLQTGAVKESDEKTNV